MKFFCRKTTHFGLLLAAVFFVLAGSGLAMAQDAPAIDYKDLKWETGYTINTLIMFLTAVLVLFMQAGFAMLEVGLNASKNTVNILFKNVMDTT